MNPRQGVQSLCDEESASIRMKSHPNLLTYTMAHLYLEVNSRDLIGSAQVLGHSNVDATADCTKWRDNGWTEASESLGYGGN